MPPRRKEDMGSVGDLRIPKVQNRLASQIEVHVKIKKTELECHVLETKECTDKLSAVLQGMRDTVAQDELWLARSDARV